MTYQTFLYKKKSYQADDKGKGEMYVIIEGDSLRLIFTSGGVEVEKLSFEDEMHMKNRAEAAIDYSYNLCVDCNGPKCHTDVVETCCGDLRKA